jgi:large subunit ribosomal protein L21
MYAIVEIAGQQFKVVKDQRLYVHRLKDNEGAKISFDKVLLIDNDGKVNVGAPVVAGASVSAKVLEHLKGDKVLVFKKKRRKGYQKENGHRQYLTQILIEGISEKGAAKKTEAKAETTEEVPVKKAATPKAAVAPKAAAPKAKKVTKTAE